MVKSLLFYLILALVLVCCVPTETAPDGAALNEVPADVATVKARDENLTVEPSPIATSTTVPTESPTSTATVIPPEVIQPTATRTVIPTATLPPLSPTPTPFETPVNALACQIGEVFTRCYDSILGIEFEYPNEWGNLNGYIYQAMEQRDDTEEWVPTGFAYNYHFDQTYGKVDAVGRSREFTESRGRMRTDFTGFPAPDGMDIICSWPFNSPNQICKEIKPNVVLLISLPASADYCQEEYARGIGAYTVVALEIPNNDLINGFMFGLNILGEDIIEEVERNLPQPKAETEPVCDDATRQAFDQQMAQLLEDINNMTITGETAHNLEMMNHLAESIVFK